MNYDIQNGEWVLDDKATEPECAYCQAVGKWTEDGGTDDTFEHKPWCEVIRD